MRTGEKLNNTVVDWDKLKEVLTELIPLPEPESGMLHIARKDETILILVWNFSKEWTKRCLSATDKDFSIVKVQKKIGI